MTPRTAKARRADPAADALLKTLNPHAAGIDVGQAEMWVCVPPGSAPDTPDAKLPPNVRCFGTFTADLGALADWLRLHQVTTVAMESTGVYWIPLYDLLESRGFAVLLIDPRQAQRAPNRPKTDVHDCQWIQRLHALGLLGASFRPEEKIRVWRSYQRHRANLVEDGARHLLRVIKALELMNLKLKRVVSDLTGDTGMRILRAIVAGERDPVRLARLRDPRCKENAETIALALCGTWRPEHLTELRHNLEMHDETHRRVRECDAAIEGLLKEMALPEVEPLDPTRRLRRLRSNEPAFDSRVQLHAMAGVDLTAIEGIEGPTALVVLSEIGTDMSRWPNEKAFGSWLGLAPSPRKSGGKLLGSATRPGLNRAAQALRLAAKNLHRSQSALGAFFRRIAARRGIPKAITATAYKMARIVYAMLKQGQEYAAVQMADYEAAYRARQRRLLERKAKEMGFRLVANESEQPQEETAEATTTPAKRRAKSK